MHSWYKGSEKSSKISRTTESIIPNNYLAQETPDLQIFNSVFFSTHTRGGHTPGLVVTDKNCVDMSSDSANMRYTISPLFVQR